MARHNGPKPNWYGMPTILWYWRGTSVRNCNTILKASWKGGWGLQLNREKTRILNLQSPGQSVDFLGPPSRYARDRLGRDKGYWTLPPSRKAVTRERAVLHEKLG